MSDIAAGVLSLEEALRWREELRRSGRTLAVTNGCFDLLHRGHAVYLERARAEADALLVLVNSDASVRALKGPTRPLQCQEDRAFLLCAKMIINAGIVEVVYHQRYSIDDVSMALLAEAGVRVRSLAEEEE